jgi:L-alanine-DL-glutamate epimerase-like enolase superfamily enzyme
MHLSEIRLFNLHLPFCREVAHSLYTRNSTEAVICVSTDESGCRGFGEGTPRHFVTGENTLESFAAAEKLARMVCGQSFASSKELMLRLENIGANDIAKQNPAAWCAVETSCLDLYAKKNNVALWRLFTQEPSSRVFHYSAVLPLISDSQALDKTLKLVQSMDIPSIKIKVADVQSGIDILSYVRKAVGPQISLRIDANAAFSDDQAMTFLEEAVKYGIQALEQPVAKEKLESLARVARLSSVPIIADESMYATDGPEHFTGLCLCQGINLRISSCGGFLNSLKVVKKAQQMGMLWQLGAHVGETAILSLAGRHFAAACKGFMHLEGSYSTFVLKEDLNDTDARFGMNGKAKLPDGAGLGIYLDIGKLERWSELLAVVK